MLKVKDIVDQSVEELEDLYKDVCKDIFELTNELRLLRKLEKPHKLKSKKKDRSRILTVLRQKKNQGLA